MDIKDYMALTDRLGPSASRRRLERQARHAADFYSEAGRTHFHIENVELIPRVLRVVLDTLGLLDRGHANSTAYTVEHVSHVLPALPPQFDGYRILQLSDLHLDGIPDGGTRLGHALSELEFDLCALTGDFRFLTVHDYAPPLRVLAGLVDQLACADGIYGILGNHDFLEMVPEMEAMGIRMLLNEGVRIHRERAVLTLCGVDDPHYYGSDDLDRARRGVDPDACTILLCHSPELYAEAEEAGFDLFLCGHTHAGQICLPGGIPLVTNAACPRRFARGAWRHGAMLGYTSRGTGASGLPVRFFCPPEITIHTLRQGSR
ncbi:hypothetical protein GGQ74_003220 [Desulfobaculum xiamenense]|uniref:Calcineurin-like phosphoesterase domain-containing protein n=1 Tax=Desulfobaculum xiamenense TaxID=995050 RepID=A0A846QY06_9BACT|nr:metallophosphoesterase [Desulfobaculum xiamenense]NJB69509.1 hypothetical protein [Desulfobaculum xiamenense]